MHPTGEEHNKQVHAVSNTASLLVALLEQLRLRVRLRAHAQLAPSANKLLNKLNESIEHLGNLGGHLPHTPEAAQMLIDEFQVAFETISWLDNHPKTTSTTTSPELVEDQPKTKIAANDESNPHLEIAAKDESDPHLELDNLAQVKHQVARIQQNLSASQHAQPNQTEHVQQPPSSKSDGPHKPAPQNPKTPE